MSVSELNITVRGIADTSAALNAMAADLRRRVVYAALRAAAKPIVQDAIENAPVLRSPRRNRVPGTLKRNIKAFRSKKANGKGGALGIYVTVKASKKDLKKRPITGDPYYWRWVENEHRIVARSKRTGTKYGKARYEKTLRARRAASSGTVPGVHFLLNAYRAKGQEAIRAFNKVIESRIARWGKNKKGGA